MKIAFPDMGSGHIFDKLFRMAGHEVIMPPPPSKETLSLGVLNTPEFACIPCKLVMGTYLEAIDRGAELIVTTGGRGPCRAGLYGEVHKRNLKRLGKNIEFMVLDAPTFGKKKIINNLKKLKIDKSWLNVYQIISYLYKEIYQIDRVEKIFSYKRAVEIEKGQTDILKKKFYKRLYNCYNNKELKNIIKWLEPEISSIKEKSNFKPLKIGIVGEIYVVMDPFINFQIEKRLADLGCYVEKNQNLTHWVDNHIVNNFPLFPFKYYKNYFKKLFNIGNAKYDKNLIDITKKYLRLEKIGGHSFDNLKDIIRFSKEGFDAVIHLMPFACLPELVSRSIIPKISKDYDFPVLTLSIDEQTGEANLQTRLEAFIDLLWSRKLKEQKLNSFQTSII